VVKFLKIQTKMRELDLTGSQLTQHDISQLILGLITGEIKLVKLTLSENSHVNDEIVKDLQLIFSHKSTLEELYLDKTNITVKGLVKLLNSAAKSVKVRVISVQDCNMDFCGENGGLVVKSLEKVISITQFTYDGNAFDQEFVEMSEQQIQLNKKIE